jgi:hypothetical protein
MKLTLTIPILAGLLTMTGCATLLSTNPFVAEEEAIVDALLAGTWTNGEDTALIAVHGKKYDVTYVDSGKEAIRFTGRLVRVGEALVLDLARDTDDPLVLALHFAVRVWPEAGALRWTLVDSDWLKEQAAGARRDGDRTIVTGEFLRRFVADERAHGKVEAWTRVQ